jgi:hypothetical protein
MTAAIKLLYIQPLLCVALLAGCATGAPSTWQKGGASETNLKQDRYACSQDARVGAVTGTDEDRVFFYGQNKLAQTEANRLYRMCMEARGWIVGERK